MKNSPENIPSLIFDWLEKYSFSSLDHSQQDEVLQYFTREEYDSMHLAADAIRSVPKTTAPRKQSLMERFESKRSKKTGFLHALNRQVSIWKAAAIFILLGAVWQFYNSSRQQGTREVQLRASIDTVYLEKEITPVTVKIVDTVYLEKPYKKKQKQEAQKEPASVNPSYDVTGGDINTLSVKDINRRSNKQKRNSIREDSLVKKYAFVTL